MGEPAALLLGDYVLADALSEDLRTGRIRLWREHEERHLNRQRPPRLTPREAEVLASVVREGGNVQGAYALGMKVQTFKNHLTHIYAKFDASTLPQALWKIGWISLPGEPQSKLSEWVTELADVRVDVLHALARVDEVLGKRP